MCILITKPAGVTISRENLLNCYENNGHGAGFVAAVNGEFVVWKHPDEKFPVFYDEFLKYQDHPMLIHFRLATHGSKTHENTHPFEVSDEWYGAHNGIIHQIKAGKDESDTRAFIRKCITPAVIRDSSVMYDDGFLDGLGDMVGHNKLAFINRDGVFRYINKDLGGDDLGCWWSNDGYKTSRIFGYSYHGGKHQYTGQSRTYAWDDDYDYTSVKKNTLRGGGFPSGNKPQTFRIVLEQGLYLKSYSWDFTTAGYTFTGTHDIKEAQVVYEAATSWLVSSAGKMYPDAYRQLIVTPDDSLNWIVQTSKSHIADYPSYIGYCSVKVKGHELNPFYAKTKDLMFYFNEPKLARVMTLATARTVQSWLNKHGFESYVMESPTTGVTDTGCGAKTESGIVIGDCLLKTPANDDTVLEGSDDPLFSEPSDVNDLDKEVVASQRSFDFVTGEAYELTNENFKCIHCESQVIFPIIMNDLFECMCGDCYEYLCGVVSQEKADAESVSDTEVSNAEIVNQVTDLITTPTTQGE